MKFERKAGEFSKAVIRLKTMQTAKRISKLSIFCVFLIGLNAFLALAQDEESMTITTYYPAPAVTYSNADAKTLKSKNTHVKNKLVKKGIVSDLFTADNTAVVTLPGLASDFAASGVNIALPYSTNTLSSNSFNISGNSVFNAMNGLLQITANGHTANMWPGLGTCSPHLTFTTMGIYEANCGENGYIARLNEYPGFYLAVGPGGAVGDGIIGAGWGVKFGLVEYTCCYLNGSGGGPVVPEQCQNESDALLAQQQVVKGLTEKLDGYIQTMQGLEQITALGKHVGSCCFDTSSGCVSDSCFVDPDNCGTYHSADATGTTHSCCYKDNTPLWDGNECDTTKNKAQATLEEIQQESQKLADLQAALDTCLATP